jgi:hypothetical protein
MTQLTRFEPLLEFSTTQDRLSLINRDKTLEAKTHSQAA